MGMERVPWGVLDSFFLRPNRAPRPTLHPPCLHPLPPHTHHSLPLSPHTGGGGHHDSVTYDGVTLHKAAGWHKALGSGLAGLMWFWIFVRFYKDGDVLLYGHAPHFEHDHEHGDEHGEGHGKGHH
jgi:hypothetical protein